MTTIGFIGAGHIGGQVARAAIAAGYDVVVSNSRGPETLEGLVAELGPKSRAATPAEAGAAGDIVMVSVPLHALAKVPVAPLANKIVLESNNYYFERDGHIEQLDAKQATVSGMLQEHLPTSRVVKAFNHIGARDITTDGTPAGTPNRRALATASDFDDAIAFITSFYDEIGFDTVNLGPLSESWRVERDMPAYGIRQNADELRSNLARATR